MWEKIQRVFVTPYKKKPIIATYETIYIKGKIPP